MHTRICCPQYRSLLAAVLFYETKARVAFNKLVSMGASDFRPGLYVVKTGPSLIDPNIWYSVIETDSILMSMLRFKHKSGTIDWKVWAIERLL